MEVILNEHIVDALVVLAKHVVDGQVWRDVDECLDSWSGIGLAIPEAPLPMHGGEVAAGCCLCHCPSCCFFIVT